jgi:carboxymethylenebutenolidase
LNFTPRNLPVATVGWCFGGGWSLKAAIQAGERADACVIYYGMPVKSAAELSPLEAPVLGIFGSEDEWINPGVVKEFDKLCKATGKEFTYEIFEADHAFANPSSERYKEEAATEANAMALVFLKDNLGL